MNKTMIKELLKQGTVSVWIALLAANMILNSALAATVQLATQPLTTAASLVKPNLMFVFDTSGSMLQEISADYLASANQCKAVMREQGGRAVTALSRSGTTLTITAPGHNFSVSNVVYLAVPGDPTFNGIYTITKRNLTTTPTTCTATNSSVIVNPPSCNGATLGNAGNPNADPPVLPTPACSCNTPAPVNNGVVGTGFIDLTTPGSTNLARCRWRDPRDSAIGTVCTASTGGGSTGPDTLEVTVANTGTSGAISVLDARILSRNDSSSCSGTRVDGDMTVSFHEPPLAAAKVNGLYYDPNIVYSPPPNPLSTATKLPSMNGGNTLNWTQVRSDGLSLSAAGAQNSTLVDITKWTDMVYCDTPDRPALPLGFANDVDWHRSSRCKSNNLASNTVASSPNYPYPYPAKSDGGVTTPSKTLIYSTNVPQQQGATVVPSASNPVVTTSAHGSYAYAERYTAANPFYYNINPIEYCTNSKLNDCRVGPPIAGTYEVPSYVRYCNSAAIATNISINPATTACNNSNVGSFTFPRYGLFERVEIKSTGVVYTKNDTTLRKDRTDCTTTAGACSYEEEMTNFANWYAYYRTRLQLMKTTAANTFNSLNENYRIGLMTVSDQIDSVNGLKNYLPISDFTSGTGSQRENWFKTLYSRAGKGGTPLRDVLTKVGKVYAGKHPIAGFASDDPVQYSCQQNFTLLTTDGYWNGDPGTKLDGTPVGNQDGANTPPTPPTPRPQFEGNAAADTLADVAKYYYETDLRTTALGNCTGSASVEVCTNDVREGGTSDTLRTQHMTTFTLGLGVDGALNYNKEYETALSGDFFNLKNNTGGVNWPVPEADKITAVDDLWHAAVNGRGTYFSAKNPQQLTDGLLTTLLKIGDSTGTASATALSNNIPVAGDNFAYSARYTSGAWTGNLFARTMASDGTLSANAAWCVEDLSTVTPPCIGSFNTRVLPNSDTRTIWMNRSGVLDRFDYDLMSLTQQSYFTPSYLSTRLSQWAGYNAYQQSVAGTSSLVGYLRGRNGFDDRGDNVVVVSPTVTNDNRLYRQRAAVLGDIVESDPVFISKPQAEYADPGYSAFVSANATRARTVYVGANDGMLHAFNADTGAERWAYVPTAVMPNLYKLADKNYRNNHTNYVNAEFTIADVCVSACNSAGVWKTILVSGLGQGGRGYFALDITDSLTNPLVPPVFLWEISDQTEPNMGFTYGKPVITKKADGTWVVLLTSGYNNVSTGDGRGHLYVLRARDGFKLADISNGTGSDTTPSGLAQISAFVDNPSKNNQARYVYGGDLSGNLWRFDLDSNTAMLFANLTQPITVAPTLGKINGKRIVYIGTGKYLEKNDLLPTNYEVQTLYAIKDDDRVTTFTPDATLEKLVLDSDRTITKKSENFSNGNGWSVDLPLGERQNVRSQLVGGILFVPTLVPPTGTCDTNGKGYLNAFDYKTGGSVDSSATTSVSVASDAPIAGLNLIYSNTDPTQIIAKGECQIKCTEDPSLKVGAKVGSEGFVGKRAVWRELIE